MEEINQENCKKYDKICIEHRLKKINSVAAKNTHTHIDIDTYTLKYYHAIKQNDHRNYD